MKKQFGNKILSAIKKLDPKCVDSYPDAGKYILEIDDMVAEVTLDPQWLGIELTADVIDRGRTKTLFYEIDTDLYRLDEEDHIYVEEIENMIANTIDALASHQIQVGTSKGRGAILVPGFGEFTLVRANKFFGAQTQIRNDSLKELLRKSKFIKVN
jgi:hypothetical protein